jgi:RNA polymerase sigma factor (TIGR02999 family)
MSSSSPQEVTGLLHAWSNGDESALDKLTPLVYAELRRLAGAYIGRERKHHTLQATALVNEAFLRMIGPAPVEWQNRAHFFAVSAQLMRRILVDFARSRGYQKRGGGALQVSLDEAAHAGPARAAGVVALDDALSALSKIDPRKARVVELRFFGGLTAEETGVVLKISPDTVLRDWRLSKAWLLRELTREGTRDA